MAILPLYSSPMMKKTAGLATVLVSVLALTGCGASGNGAPTRLIRQVTDGVEGQSGSILVQDLLLVNQPDGSATLVGTIINESATDDSLTGITVKGMSAVLSAPTFDLAPNAPVIFAGDSANASGNVPGLNAQPGDRVDVVVSFAHAAPIKLSALIRAKSDYFANVGPTSSAATPSPSPTASK